MFSCRASIALVGDPSLLLLVLELKVERIRSARDLETARCLAAEAAVIPGGGGKAGVEQVLM